MKELKLGQAKKTSKYSHLVTLVDDEDYEWLLQWKWFASPQKTGNFYVCATNKKTNGDLYVMFLHREVLRHHALLDENKQVDHIDRDGLNNQKNNLRCATRSENQRNRRASGRSKYIGVSLAIQKHKHITLDGRERIYESRSFVVGIKKQDGKYERRYGLKNEVEAALIYNKLAKEHHGEFANLNCVPIPSIHNKQYLHHV